MATVPIRAIKSQKFVPSAQWIASQHFEAHTYHLLDPGGIEPDDMGRMIIPSGTPVGTTTVPGTITTANGATTFGLIVNDADVTVGSTEIAVMIRGTIYEERLPVELSAGAKTALEGKILPRNGAWL